MVTLAYDKETPESFMEILASLRTRNVFLFIINIALLPTGGNCDPYWAPPTPMDGPTVSV